jgi:hypothetical protein
VKDLDLACTTPAMAASAVSCAHCGKEGVELKRCLRCKEVSYCGAECQKAAWKIGHKKTCVPPPLPLKDAIQQMEKARDGQDWQGVLKWEGRLEEMMAGAPDIACDDLLVLFISANRMGKSSSGNYEDHTLSIIGLEERRLPLLGNLQRFRDQGEGMCTIGDGCFSLRRDGEYLGRDTARYSVVVPRGKDAAGYYYQAARDVGAAHGFFSIECNACVGLGKVAVDEGRHEEGAALLRNALTAAELNELDDPTFEINVLDELIEALFKMHAMDEAEPLVLRYREAAKAQAELKGGFCYAALHSLYASARLHEVLCICTLRWAPLPTALSLASRTAKSDSHRFHRA